MQPYSPQNWHSLLRSHHFIWQLPCVSLCRYSATRVGVTGYVGMSHAASSTRFLAICDVPLCFPNFRHRLTIVEQSNKCSAASNFQWPGEKKFYQNSRFLSRDSNLIHLKWPCASLRNEPTFEAHCYRRQLSPGTSSHKDGRSNFR
jgi:hypothetical protein